MQGLQNERGQTVAHICRIKFERPSKVEWVTNVRMLAHPRCLVFGLQEQGNSRQMLRDPRGCTGGTHEVDEEDLLQGIGVWVAA